MPTETRYYVRHTKHGYLCCKTHSKVPNALIYFWKKNQGESDLVGLTPQAIKHLREQFDLSDASVVKIVCTLLSTIADPLLSPGEEAEIAVLEKLPEGWQVHHVAHVQTDPGLSHSQELDQTNQSADHSDKPTLKPSALTGASEHKPDVMSLAKKSM